MLLLLLLCCLPNATATSGSSGQYHIRGRTYFSDITGFSTSGVNSGDSELMLPSEGSVPKLRSRANARALTVRNRSPSSSSRSVVGGEPQSIDGEEQQHQHDVQRGNERATSK